MNPSRCLLSLAVAALLLACGGGGNSGGGNGLPGPTNLHASLGPGPKDFSLIWTPPTGVIDGYNLEAKSGSDAFQQVNGSLIPSTYTSLAFTFTETAPEDTDYAFRLNAARGAQTSAYSNETHVNSGLHAPSQPAGQYDWDRSGIALTWIRNTTASTGLKVERAPSDAYGSVLGSWSSLAVSDPLAATYLDTTVALGSYYTYRVTNQKGATASAPSYTSPGIYTGLPAPSQATAAYDFTEGGMRLSWTRNTTFNDGVRVERVQMDSYGTQIGSWSELTPPAADAASYLDTTCPLNTYQAYRITNLRNGAASTASSPSYPAYAGLVPPNYLYAYWSSSSNSMYVYWYAYSTYDSFKIERAVADASGQPIGTWTTIATPPSSPAYYYDTTTAELTYYTYRISGVRGTVTSQPCTSSAVQTPMAAPSDLTVASTDQGAQLTWQNHSTSATQLVVRRGPWNNTYTETDIAVLSSSTTSYTDPVGALGYYHYKVVAKSGTSEAASLPALYATPNPADALALTPASRAFPDASDGSIAPAGTWGLASASPFGMLSNGDSWGPYFPGDRQWNPTHTVRMDAQGHPHLIYAVTNPTNSMECLLRHAWHDGTTWKTEVVGHTQTTYYYSDTTAEFALDATGSPHLVVNTGSYSGSTSGLAYLHKVDGAWVQESMAGLNATFSYYSTCRLSLGTTNEPRLLAAAYGGVYECTRDAQGTWSATLAVPTSSGTAGFVWGTWTDSDNGTALYTVYSNYPSYGVDLMEVQKVGGVWQSPTSVRHIENSYPTLDVAQSSDASRLALVWQDPYGAKVAHRDAQGWHQTLVANPADSYSYWYRIGFDASGKVHLLFKNTPLGSGYQEYME